MVIGEHELHKGEAKDRHYDAIVVGGSLSGLVTAAILGKRGFKVALVEALDVAGGKIGANQYRGLWLSLGHRDAESGVADIAATQTYRTLAERAAGIEVELMVDAVAKDAVLLHHLSSRTTETLHMHLLTGSADADPEVRMQTMLKCFAAEARDPTGAAAGLQEALAKLASISEDEAWLQIDTRMGDWVQRNVCHPEARRAMINYMETVCALPGEEASVGRFVLSMAWRYGSPHWIKDPDVAGMQAIIQPWVRAIEANGGELWLGWKPVEILIERERIARCAGGMKGRAAGAVAINKCNLVQVFRAPIVISDHYGWDLPKLVERDLIPDSFIERAERTRSQQSEAIGFMASFNRMPRIRRTGKAETFSGWQRLFYGKGMTRRYHMTYRWTTLADPGDAPEGKYQFLMSGMHRARFRSWEDMRASVDYSLEYLRDYYLDWDEAMDWGRHFWTLPPQLFAWHLLPGLRHPVKVATVEGLYCASSTAECMAGWLDSEYQVALEAVDHIETEFGRPDGTRSTALLRATNAQRAARQDS